MKSLIVVVCKQMRSVLDARSSLDLDRRLESTTKDSLPARHVVEEDEGCVHKVVQSDPGSVTQITGFQPTFTNALCNKSWLLNWQVTDLTSVINLLQRPEWY